MAVSAQKLQGEVPASAEKAGGEVFCIAPQTADAETHLLCLFLQGLVNRGGAALFFIHRGCVPESRWMTGGFSQCDEEFMRWYGERYGYVFLPPVSDLKEIVARFAARLNGVVLFDEEDVQGRVAAYNLASHRELLPVPARMYRERADVFSALPVVGHVSCAGEELSAVYARLMKEFLPACSREEMFSLGYRYRRADGKLRTNFNYWGLDRAVRERQFIFLLSCNERRRGSYDFMVEGSPEEYAVFAELLRSFTGCCALGGWNEPEWRWAAEAARFGHFVYCTDGAFNLSFHAAVPCGRTQFPFNKPRRAYGKPKNKVYITITANEGDTPKMASQLYNNAWLSARRGEVPVNWAFNPYHCRALPALAEYYLETAKENDCFSVAPNGVGYTCLREAPHPEEFFRKTNECLAGTGMRYADLWFSDRESLERYFSLCDVDGAMLEPHMRLPRGEILRIGGKTAVRYPDRLYYWYNRGDLCTDYTIDGDGLRAYLESYYDPSRPAFVPIYGYEADMAENFADFAATLDKEKFEIVDYAAFFAFASQCASELARPPLRRRGRELAGNALGGQYCWEAYDGKALLSHGEGVLWLTIPPDAERVQAGLRSDMLSTTCAAGSCCAMAVLRDVVLPQDADELSVTVREIGQGCDWMIWLYGDFEGFGLTDKWEPFWKPDRPGERTEAIPGRVKRSLPSACDVILCVEGEPGGYAVFGEVAFRNAQKNKGG